MKFYWNRYLDRLEFPGEHGSKDAIFKVLDAQYSRPDRQYHNWEHIKYCLDLFEEVRDRCYFPKETESALWFHDVVYEPQNIQMAAEKESAELFEETLIAKKCGLRVDMVKAFINYTNGHYFTLLKDAKIEAPDAHFVQDIDLAILGAHQSRYERYANQIRKEFEHVKQGAYEVGRSDILIDFLERKRIYKSHYFYERLEESARKNLGREVRLLMGVTA